LFIDAGTSAALAAAMAPTALPTSSRSPRRPTDLAAHHGRPRPTRRAARAIADLSTAALVERHLGLTRALACQLIRAGVARQLELDELVSLGTVALLEAARRFDPTAGARFSTFAYPRLRGAMIDGIAQLSPIKRSAYRTARRHQAAGKPGLQIGSLDAMLEHGHEPAAEFVDPGETLDRVRQHRAVVAALGTLPERKRRFVEGHYVGGRGLKEIGDELGLSKSWSSRLHAQTLADLRQALDEGVSNPDERRSCTVAQASREPASGTPRTPFGVGNRLRVGRR
jgi:RNA polymerase sigma factor FliA